VSPAALLAALAIGIHGAPAAKDCAHVWPMLGVTTSILAGNFRIADSRQCVVWLNLAQVDIRWNRREICTLGAHEATHLAGFGHSEDPHSYMVSPFEPRNVAPWCRRLKPFHRRRPIGFSSSSLSWMGAHHRRLSAPPLSARTRNAA
jgi:hypothetical protein